MGMVDPVWTESNWDTLRVHVYTVQHSAYDNAVLVAGITVTTLAYIGILAAKSIITKALKQDWDLYLIPSPLGSKLLVSFRKTLPNQQHHQYLSGRNLFSQPRLLKYVFELIHVKFFITLARNL